MPALSRDHSNDLHVVRIDDDDLVLIDEIQESAPSRLDLHERVRHRHGVDSVARNGSAYRYIEVNTADPWPSRTMSVCKLFGAIGLPRSEQNT